MHSISFSRAAEGHTHDVGFAIIMSNTQRHCDQRPLIGQASGSAAPTLDGLSTDLNGCPHAAPANGWHIPPWRGPKLPFNHVMRNARPPPGGVSLDLAKATWDADWGSQESFHIPTAIPFRPRQYLPCTDLPSLAFSQPKHFGVASPVKGWWSRGQPR